MLRLKDNSVRTEGTTRELWFALGVAERVFGALGYDCIVTSLTDGTHKAGSLHSLGKATDLRTKHITKPETVSLVFERLKTALRPYGFDVVPEGGVAGAADQTTALTTGAHIHIEFDPKAGEPCLTL